MEADGFRLHHQSVDPFRMTRFDLYIITTQGGEDIMSNWFTRYHIGELEDEKPRKKKKKKLTKEEKAKKKAEKEELRKEKVEKKADKIAKKNRKEVEDILVDFRVAESLSDYEKGIRHILANNYAQPASSAVWNVSQCKDWKAGKFFSTSLQNHHFISDRKENLFRLYEPPLCDRVVDYYVYTLRKILI